MDNVTHTLIGLVLARTALGRRAQSATAALVVAANFPDVDVLPAAAIRTVETITRHVGGKGPLSPSLMLAGDANYLAHHRGITHAALGLAIEWLLLWAFFARLDRRGRAAHEPPGKLGLVVLLGLATHPLLDLLNVYGIRPWLPFDARWAYGDLLFIVDPWFWLLLAPAALLAGKRTRLGSIAWALLAVAATAVIFGLWFDRTTAPLRIAWPLAILLMWRLRTGEFGTRRPNALLVATGLAVIGYLALLGAARARAERIGIAALLPRLPAGESIVDVTAMPKDVRPLRWTVIAVTERHVEWQDVDLVDGPAIPLERERNQDDPRVQVALATRAGRAWASFARFPIASFEKDDLGRDVVVLQDARYFAQKWCILRVPVQ